MLRTTHCPYAADCEGHWAKPLAIRVATVLRLLMVAPHMTTCAARKLYYWGLHYYSGLYFWGLYFWGHFVCESVLHPGCTTRMPLNLIARRPGWEVFFCITFIPF
jgi:hypothetical protein